jgi:quinohemoprotein ethanol dehydrogenase
MTIRGMRIPLLRYPLPAILSAAILATACGDGRLLVTDATLSDETLVSQWAAYGGTHFERRYSPLTDIDTDNVDELTVDWYLDLPRDVGLVSTPLVVDGVLYFTGTMNVVRAVDAVTGELLWEFDPKVGDALAGER